jgi:RNA polymerase sigma-70 factor (ECF subfamily)
MTERSDHPGNAFLPTQWTMVAAAGGQPGPAQREALAGLLRRYLPPLRAYLVRCERLDEAAADDVLSAFVEHKVLQRDLLAEADRRKGRFRTFLLTCLRRFLINERAREGRRRGTALENIPEPVVDRAAPDVFDIAWARQTLAEVLRRMRESCQIARRPDIWGVFEGRIVAPILDGAAVISYESMVERYGYRSPTQASAVLVTGKRMFDRTLREVVGEYASDADEVEEEIRDLFEVLAGGRS